MKITLFTSNQSRHNYLINKLGKITKKLYVIQENDTRFPGLISGHYPASDIFEKYFNKVNSAEKKIFGENYISCRNINLLPLVEGDINKCKSNFLSDFLNSDMYIVTGSSYIKGDLADYLIKKKAISIHMGLAPYYRGTDCNFWALYDGNPELVGATIYLLSKGLDTGKILYHAISQIKNDPFVYTMSCVKSAFDSLVERIKNNSIYKNEPIVQDKSKEVRYSKKRDFNEMIIKKFFKKKINLDKKKLKINLYKNPYILNKIKN